MRGSPFFLLLVGAWAVAQAQQTPVYPRIETGAHSAATKSIDVDSSERFLFSASLDKTVRVWDLQTGKPLGILRPPIGPGHEGELDAVATTPDGSQVAAGGFTGANGDDTPIYVFDRESGAIRKTITGLSQPVGHLAYSKDGRYLAVGLVADDGIRVYRADDYAEVARDDHYGDSSYWVEFDKAGRLLTVSDDGFVRLYDSNFHLLYKRTAPGGKLPMSANFSPDGLLIAVGFSDTNAVDVLSAANLSFLYAAATPPDNGKNLEKTQWLAEGRTVCAAGHYSTNGVRSVVCWANAGKGTPSTYPVASDTIMDLRSLRDGAVAFASGDGTVGVLDRAGTARWRAAPDLLNVSGHTLRVSSDGGSIEVKPFFFDRTEWQARHTISFSISDEALIVDRPSNVALFRPVTSGLAIKDWEDHYHPTLNGHALPLLASEMSRSLAIAPGAGSFVLGTDWSIRKFNREGKQIWSIEAPGVAWQVNITADRRFVVATLGDGTIRWYDFERGQEILALFVDRDLQRWVAWNPDGFFTFKSGGDSLIGYQVNHGFDQAGQFVKVDQLREVFYRADLIDHIFTSEGEAEVLAARNQIGDVSQTLSAGLPPQIELVSSLPADVIDSYPLQFKIKDMGGGVGHVVYRIDGAEIEGRSVDIAGTARDTISRSIPIGSGQHTLTVAAYSANGKVLGQAATIRLTGRQPPQGSQPSLYVIAAGISHYSDHSLWDGVRFASADAELVAARFKQQEGKGLYQKVTAVPLEDSRATAKGIQDAVAQVAGEVRPGDTFVLYLAGHGIAVSGVYYFIPWEAEYSNQEAMLNKSLDREAIQTLLKKIPTNKSVLILDTCNSGAFVEGRDAASEKAAIEKVATMSGHAILAASNSDEMAMDGYQGHGVFTYALLEGMTKADSDAQGQVLITRLAEYVQTRVPEITLEKWHYRQTPLSEAKGDVFPIVHRAPN